MKLLLFAVVAIVATEAVSEEIVNCNGRWTNQPCDSVSSSLPVKKRVISPEEARARSEKESLLHRLTMRSIEAKRSYGVELDIGGARAQCTASNQTLEACREEVERLEDRLEKRLKVAKKSKQEEEERKKKSREDNNQTTVVIGQPIPFIIDPPIYDGGGIGRVPWMPERTRSGARITPPTSPTATPWR
jgi:hypothetical protein